MGIVVMFMGASHGAHSSTLGRGTSEGHAQSSGHLPENQVITSSYFRAVNVVDPALTRSKKRQSPAARRPTVVKLYDRAAAKVEAHAKRFERSSVSIMGPDDSRSFPTLQQKSVGKVQLAGNHKKSDKSAMRPADEIRQILLDAMQREGDLPIPLAQELGLERNHIRDFLEGKKDSMKAPVLLQLSDRYGIPLKDLIVPKEKYQRRRA